MSKDSEFDIYYIPPNFIEGGTILDGLFKLRNVIESGILVFITGMPVFMLELDITSKVLILCFTALPIAIIGLVGISGESLFSYTAAFIRFIIKRRIITNTKNKKIKEK